MELRTRFPPGAQLNDQKKMQIEENVTLAPLTTFQIGGAARFFVRVSTIEELKEAFDFAQAQNLRTQILGGGSNVLFGDEGFDGLVIKIELTGVEFQNEMAAAAAGESWDKFVAQTIEKNLWGLENLSGIPGTVGGAVAGSIGAYGAAVAQTVEWVEALEVESGEVKRLTNAQCQFGYRESLFSEAEPVYGGVGLPFISPERIGSAKLVILRAAFALSTAPKPELLYKDLAERFLPAQAGAGKNPSLAEIRQAVLEIRAKKFPDLSAEGTAGSFFKNPVLEASEAQKLAEKYPGLPLFPMPEAHGRMKVPLAWLLDHVLELHGTKIDGARLFENQILVIAVQPGARAADVRALAQQIAEKAKKEIGLEISSEVKIIG